MFNIVVCAKAVPDPKEACNIKIDPATKTLMRCDVPLAVNPLDKNAIEAALSLKEQMDICITVISMGPPGAAHIVRECLALGADQGILLADPAFAGADAYATAYALARCIERIGTYDLILCGMASSDGSTEWVGPEIGVFLGLPVVTRVKEILNIDNDGWTVKSSIDTGYRLVRVELPAVLTVTRELNTPRTLTFSGIIKAGKKEISQWRIEDLRVSEDKVGEKGSPTIVSGLIGRESKREVQLIGGTREEKADFLVKKLAEEGVI